MLSGGRAACVVQTHACTVGGSVTMDGHDDPDGTGAAQRPWAVLASGELALAAVLVVVIALVLRAATSIVWFGDLLAIGLPVLGLAAFVALVGCVALGISRRWRLVLWCVGTACVALTFQPRVGFGGDPPVDPVVLVAANLKWNSRSAEAGATDVVAADADVAVISEIRPPTDRLLRAAFPHRAIGAPEISKGGSDQAVYSRFALEVVEHSGLPTNSIVVRVDAPHPFTLIAIHVPRPVLRYRGGDGITSFAAHRRAIEQLAGVISNLSADGPVVLAGDLNLSDRMAGYRRLREELDDALVDGVAGGTFFPDALWAPLSLRIDHILISPSWCSGSAGTIDVEGSDHRAVRAAIGPCP